jgi:hypothetical protein
MPSSRFIAKKDDNRVAVLIGVSSKNITIGEKTFEKGKTPVPVAVNPATGAIQLTSAS